MDLQWHQKINQCERQTIQGNDQSKECSDEKENMRSTKPTEIKLLIFWGSAETAITRNTSNKIIESSGAIWQGIHDVVYSKKSKKKQYA